MSGQRFVTAEGVRKICAHCKQMIVNRPRGLCWGCYYKPGVKDMYPSTSKYAHRGHGNYGGGKRGPRKPTKAPPGSAEKILVLERRARAALTLWHPNDSAGYEDVKKEEDLPASGGGYHWRRRTAGGLCDANVTANYVRALSALLECDCTGLDSPESEPDDWEALE